MARPKSLNFEGQRHMIVCRAAELFAGRGYQGTSMNEVAQACALSKATLYHYYADKYDLLLSIADDHVSMLVELTENPDLGDLPGAARLKLLITRFMQAYSTAQSQHRVLTEDVKFLDAADRKRVLDKERRVVSVFANAITDVRPDLFAANLSKPLAMLLFGTLNWMFTWFKRDGELTHATFAPVVIDLFFGGLMGITLPVASEGERLEGLPH